MSVEETFSKLCLSSSDNADAIAIKTLVFKPKTAKTAVPVPIIVVALQSTQTPSNVIAHVTKTKDPRLARDELFQSFFQCEKATEFDLNYLEAASSEFSVLLDNQLIETDSEKKLSLNEGKFIIQQSQLVEYLQKYSPTHVDFSQEIVSPAPAAKGAKKDVKKDAKKDGALEDAKLIGITVDKAKDFPGWYQQILTKGEMLDYYDVSGCYILRPASYAIWETIQKWFDTRIKRLGVANTYFPMFVSNKVLEKEKDHIEGFAPEVAWVTKAGSSELDEPIAIRPTSETVMYPYFAKWIQSYRDLPLKLNQWNNVVRWEFKHPQPFLRTREFLWQEGHTAHLTSEEAQEEVMQILDFYAGVYEELLAVPVIKGKKTEHEKFAGGVFTTTCEGYIPQTGRGIQGATSHFLGQNFSKMFNFSVENPLGSEHPKLFAFQNSWGLSTRSIGVMVMIHSDNKGLVIPPRVSQFQAVIIPVGVTSKTSEEERTRINKTAKEIESRLLNSDIRATGDYRDNYNPGWKFANWELKGVPLRLEFGPKDLQQNQVTVVRRNDSKKIIVKLDDHLELNVQEILDVLQQDLYNAAKAKYDSHRVIVDEWNKFVPALNAKNVILSPWCGVEECEEDIKASSSRKDDGEEFEEDDKAPSMGAKSLCMPFEQPPLKLNQKCIKCEKKAVTYCMFGRSY